MKLTIYFMALCLVLVSCSDNGTLKFDVAKSDLKRNMSPSADMAGKLAKDNTDFAFNLYRGLEKEGNLFMSPHSISLALAMTYAGARGDTALEMKQALNFTLDDAKLHEAFNYLDLYFDGLTAQKKFRLNIVNAAWAQKDFSFQDSYLDVLALNYGAGLNLLDFSAKPEPSRKTINAWVEKETNNRIKNLLPNGSINSLTRLVLTNAIYFLADWEREFDNDATYDADFTLADGKAVTARMMRQTAFFRYLRESAGLYQALSMPYKDSPVSMMVILPAAGKFSEVEALLSSDLIKGIIDGMSPADVNLYLPKFEFDYDVSLVEPLKALGMKKAFTEEADFSGISTAEQLAVSDVLHKAFVKVDEKGTEAAAATAVIVGATSAPEEDPVVFRADRPFIFLIRDDVKGVILFAGRCSNPAL